MKGFLKGLGIAVSAIVLTTFTIDAADNLGNMKQSILGAVLFGVIGESSPCPEDMAIVDTSEGGFCIDVYEASAGSDCPYLSPLNQDETRINLNMESCDVTSEKGKLPWRNISQNQATLACVKMGKRLPTSEEWYLATLGTPDKDNNWNAEDCNVDMNWGNEIPGETGSGDKCVSAYGVYDMVGNVWEWISETVNYGVYKDMNLPQTGYVHSVNESGTPLETGNTPDENYFKDKFWIDSTTITGIFRGGYWSSKSDGGMYSMHTQVPPSFVGEAVGFRCVKNLSE